MAWVVTLRGVGGDAPGTREWGYIAGGVALGLVAGAVAGARRPVEAGATPDPDPSQREASAVRATLFSPRQMPWWSGIVAMNLVNPQYRWRDWGTAVFAGAVVLAGAYSVVRLARERRAGVRVFGVDPRGAGSGATATTHRDVVAATRGMMAGRLPSQEQRDAMRALDAATGGAPRDGATGGTREAVIDATRGMMAGRPPPTSRPAPCAGWAGRRAGGWSRSWW